MRIRIVAPSKVRPSAFKLKDELIEEGFDNVKLINKDIFDTRFVKREGDFVINWGCSTKHPLTENADMNDYKRVAIMSNKLAFFKLMEKSGYGDKIPKFYTPEEFGEGFSNLPEGVFVFRQTLTGSGGKGVVVAENDSEGTLHILYSDCPEDCLVDLSDIKTVTEYFPGKYEFRFHVVGGNCLHIQRKALRTDEERPENVQFYVRNHSNGFIFEQNFEPFPDDRVFRTALALEELSDKFGFDIVAYDVRMKENGDWKIIEANSAPGLEGTTLDRYAHRISQIISGEIR